jgi:hypothetical protein
MQHANLPLQRLAGSDRRCPLWQQQQEQEAGLWWAMEARRLRAPLRAGCDGVGRRAGLHGPALGRERRRWTAHDRHRYDRGQESRDATTLRANGGRRRTDTRCAQTATGAARVYGTNYRGGGMQSRCNRASLHASSSTPAGTHVRLSPRRLAKQPQTAPEGPTSERATSGDNALVFAADHHQLVVATARNCPVAAALGISVFSCGWPPCCGESSTLHLAPTPHRHHARE